MGFAMLAYLLLALSAGFLGWHRQRAHARPRGLRPLHLSLGITLVLLVLLLLTIGLVGTCGHYGNIGHSIHLVMGLAVVALVLVSAGSASQIHPQRPWVRALHVSLNALLLLFLGLVSLTGWDVVQKYLP